VRLLHIWEILLCHQNKDIFDWMNEKMKKIKSIFKTIVKKKWGIMLLSFTLIMMICISLSSIGQIIINNFSMKESSERYVSMYYCVFIILSTFTLFSFSWEAVIGENEFQLVGFIFMSFALTVRVTYQLIREINYSENNEKDLVLYTIIIPTVIVYFSQIMFLIIIYPTWRSFGWKIFNIVGTSTRLHSFFFFNFNKKKVFF
jgi:hypothetical protein